MAASLPPCEKKSFARIGDGFTCVYAPKGYPFAEVVTEFLSTHTVTFSLIVVVCVINRFLYFLAQSKFRGKPMSGFLIVVLSLTMACVLASFGMRLQDWVPMNERGYHAFTILYMISQGCMLVSIAFLVMNFVDRFLLNRDELTIVKGYNIITKIICSLYILLAAGQVAFYAGISIKFRGSDVELVRQSHKITIGTNGAIIAISVLMFLVGPVIANHPSATKQVRYRASLCIMWALFTICLSGTNIYAIKLFLLDEHVAPPELSATFEGIVKSQNFLAPYISTNPILWFTTLMQIANNLMLLGSKSDEMFSPFESIFKWIKWIITGRYHMGGAAISDHSTDGGRSTRDFSLKSRTGGRSRTDTDDGGDVEMSGGASPTTVRKTDYSRRSKPPVNPETETSSTSSSESEVAAQ